MRIYYWNVRKNFGDMLTSLLIKKFTGLDSEWTRPEDAELFGTGSILEKVPSYSSAVIAGSGKLHEKTVLNFPDTKILGLRGYLTSKAVGRRGSYVIADPGLLADELVPLPEKEYNLGLVPHWTDNSLEYNPTFLKYNPKIIRVSDDPLKVIEEIGKCRKVVSSSLHGIILADAFSIPRRIEIAPRMLSHAHQEGGLFKWNDYLSSIEMKLEIGITQEPKRFIVPEKQHELFDMFREIKAIFK